MLHQALADAERCIARQPNFIKGYNRSATALAGLHRCAASAPQSRVAICARSMTKGSSSLHACRLILVASVLMSSHHTAARPGHAEAALRKGLEIEPNLPWDCAPRWTSSSPR